MMSKNVIKIISLILAGLMILSAFAVLMQVFAADVNIQPINPANLGDNDLDYIIPIVLIVVGIAAVIICLILPKLKRNNKDK